MLRAISLVVNLVLLLGLASGAQAIIYNYTFSGVTPYGTASASMVLDVTGDRLTMTLENTSPVSSGNFPSITSIRLWSDPAISALVVPSSWALSAGRLQNGALLPSILSDYRWSRSGGSFSTTDAIFGIFNPAVSETLPSGLISQYGNVFTPANMRLSFNGDIESLLTSSPSLVLTYAGLQGGGSIALAGSGSPANVPEPATLLLLGAGLIGLAALRKRK